MTDERLYLVHIIESIVRVEEYTRAGRGEFFASTFMQDATKDRYPEIPWREIAGFRNKVAHDYFDVNLDVVWNVIEHFLPPLKRIVAMIMADRYGIAPSA